MPVRDEPIYRPIPVRKPTPVPLPNSTQLISEKTAAIYLDTPAFGGERPEPPSNKLLYLVTVVSGLSSATTLLGLMSTTLLAWKKDRREAEQARIDNETKRFDLEIKRKSHTPAPNNRPRKKNIKNVKRA